MKKNSSNIWEYIDSTLSWKYHITNISKKISQSIGIMYKEALLTLECNEKCIL